MNTMNVIIVKIFITESSHQLKDIVNYLGSQAKIKGISVFRAISGYGESGVHTSMLTDLSLDLPLCIEFFDIKEKIEPALEYLNAIVKPSHMIFWDAKVNAQ